MQIKNLLQEDDAVSPVIGVILMVAITVILAAVIASFVLGLGGQTTKTPTASFSWNYNNVTDSDTGEGVVEVSHDGGDTIKVTELYFRGSGFVKPFDNYGNDGSEYPQITSPNTQWDATNATGKIGDTTAVVAGNTITIGAASDFEMSLVWQPQSGDSSATLSQKKGPDA